jgi:hypothetical protein
MRVVLFTGSRGWQDVDTLIDCASTMRQPWRGIIGDADGLDTLMWEVMAELGIPRMRFKAKWHLYGRKAGHVRNGVMLDWLEHFRRRGLSCFVVAGWDGSSPGTRNCMQAAARRGFDVWRLQYVKSLNGGR